MRMRQSLTAFEHAFIEEMQVDRRRAEELRRQAAVRARQREVEKAHKHGTMRFGVLVLTLFATAVLVTVVMFRVLYVVMG
jgi:hypothetical protein